MAALPLCVIVITAWALSYAWERQFIFTQNISNFNLTRYTSLYKKNKKYSEQPDYKKNLWIIYNCNMQKHDKKEV